MLNLFLTVCMSFAKKFVFSHKNKKIKLLFTHTGRKQYITTLKTQEYGRRKNHIWRGDLIVVTSLV